MSSSPKQINIDLGAPLVEVTQSVSLSRLNEAIRVVVSTLNNHEQLIHNLLNRTSEMEKKQESMQRELNRIAPAHGASSAELLEQLLELKRDLQNLSEKTAEQNKELNTCLGDRLTTAEENIKTAGEQRTRDLIAREKDFTQLTTDLQKLSTRLNALVIPDVQPLESAQKSLTKRMDEAEKLLMFASSFAAVWDADAARVEAFQKSGSTEEKVEYVHSLPPMKQLRNQMLQELRVQAVERLDMLTHELRDKVDLHKLTDLLGAVDEQLNELRVEDGRQERRLVSLEQGPLRISSIEDTLRRLQQSKADVSSLDLKADLAALQGLVQSINTIQDDINDLYDRVPRGGGGGNNPHEVSVRGDRSMRSDPKVSFRAPSTNNSASIRPSHQNQGGIPQMPTAASAAGSLKLGASQTASGAPAADQAAVNALERRVSESELQIKRLDDLKANRSELLRLHEYLDSKLQNFSALTSSAVAQANAAASAASRTLEAAAKKEASSKQQNNNNNNENNVTLNDGNENNNNNNLNGSSSIRSPAPPTTSNNQHQRPGSSSHNNNNNFPMVTLNQNNSNNVGNTSMRSAGGGAPRPNVTSPQRAGGALNKSVFQNHQNGVFSPSPVRHSQQNGGSPMPTHRQQQQGLNVDGHSAMGDSFAGSIEGQGQNISPTIRRSPLPTARIGNSWHIGRSSVAVRDSAGVTVASASLVPKFDESTMNEKTKSRSRSNSLQTAHDVAAPLPHVSAGVVDVE